MSIFVDKRFEELDWISKAVEPVESSLNEIIGYLPEEIEVSAELIFNTLDRGKQEIKVFDVIYSHVKTKDRKVISNTQDESYIAKAYDIEFRHEDGRAYDENDQDNYLDSGPLLVKFDTQTKHLTGKIFLKKNSSGLSEDDIASIFGRKGYNAVTSIYHYNASFSRIKDVIEMMGPIPNLEEERSSSVRKRLVFLRKAFWAIASKNLFNIKSVDLMDKLGEWIYSYIVKGDEVAFANICKLKIMTTMGAPIYSMEIEVGK